MQLRKIIDTTAMSGYQIMVVFLCFVLNMNDGMDVLVVSYTGPEIIEEWGLTKSEMGWVFSMGLIGMTLGSFFLAPFGDKIGRRKLFIIALILNTVGMISVYFVTSYAQILVLRVLTGLGIGGILPTMATITSEFSNKATHDFNVGLIQGGWPLGAILTGFFAAWAVPEYGWRFAYLFAGSISLLMLIAIYFLMPESLDFLAQHSSADKKAKIVALLKRMKKGELADNVVIESTGERISTSSKRIHLSKVLSPNLKPSTIRLWTAIFFGFLTLYTLMSWVPGIARDSGMPFEMATYAGMMLNLGALIGVVVMSYFANRYGPKRTILAFLLTAFCIMLLYANVGLTYMIMFILIFFIGFFVQGGFNTLFPIATRVYPAQIRSTGVGLAMGIGRFGAILGPLLFGVLSDWQLSIETLFTIFSVPLVIAALMAYSIPSKNLD